MTIDTVRRQYGHVILTTTHGSMHNDIAPSVRVLQSLHSRRRLLCWHCKNNTTAMIKKTSCTLVDRQHCFIVCYVKQSVPYVRCSIPCLKCYGTCNRTVHDIPTALSLHSPVVDSTQITELRSWSTSAYSCEDVVDCMCFIAACRHSSSPSFLGRAEMY